MNDNDIIQIVRNFLMAQLPLRGVMNVEVKQNYQPTQQGLPETPLLSVHKISAPRYGFPGVKHVYNAMTNVYDTTESIWRTPTFQFSGLAQQNPADLTSLTASDIVEAAADVLQSRAAIDTFQQHNIGILRVQQIPIMYFVNDKDRHEQDPSFDLVLQYRRVFTSTTPEIDGFRPNILRV